MASPSTNVDLEAQVDSVTKAQLAIIPSPPPTADAANPQLPTSTNPQSQVTYTDEHHNGNTPASKNPDNSQVQRDENHGDPSDGLWSMYLTEAEKQDAEVTESWNGDANGILVFTGLFSATVAAFIIESYKMLSPDSGEITNALLTQLSTQLFNISNGTPLASVTTQSIQPFKPTTSAVRVNVLWFLSLILSLNCALSATLMQQWARRYRELAQRRGTFHRRGRMRAYIFEGINRFGMARAVATMPTLLHISVFLFFAGLVDFLFPIHTSVACAALGCIGVFALAYAILTVLPVIYLNCPYATPLSGFTWRISQLTVFVFLWTTLEIRGLFPKSLSKLRILANRYARETHGPKKWWSRLSRFTRNIPRDPVFVYNWAIMTIQGLYHESLSKLRGLVNQRAPETRGQKKRWEKLEKQVKIHRQRFSQSLRKTAELSAYEAESTVVTSALEWTLTALDEDKEIEDFAARMPGFFDSRVVPDATLAVLPLMYHQPNADPVFGSRLYDLLKTCIPETSILDENTRRNRLSVCMKCLWYYGRAYNQLGSSQVLPSYFLDAFASPEITRRIQAEEDPGVRMIGCCFAALIVNMLVPDLGSHALPISDGSLACLSAILGTDSDDLEFLLQEPGAVALANLIPLAFGKVGTLVADGVSRDVPDVVKQTRAILSQALPAQENAEPQLFVAFNKIDGMFECMLVSRLLGFLNTRILVPSGHKRVVHRSCLRMCLKGLWYSVLALNQLRHSVALSPFIYVTLAIPKMTHRIREQDDPAVRVIGRCIDALVVNKLAADINLRNAPVNRDELACLSAILGTKGHDMELMLRYPGAIEITNMVFLALDFCSFSPIDRVPLYVLDVVRQTFNTLSLALPPALNTKIRPTMTGTLTDGTSSLMPNMDWSVLRVWMKNLWAFMREYNQPGKLLPLYVCTAFTNPEMMHRIYEQSDPAIHVIGRCVGALAINKLVADINLRNSPVGNDELACLSTGLGTDNHDIRPCLSRPGTIELVNLASFALGGVGFLRASQVLPDTRSVIQKTLNILSRALPAQENAGLPLDQTVALDDSSDDKFEYAIVHHLDGLLKICIPGASSLTEDVRISCLRLYLKILWHCGKAHHQTSVRLPSYFPLVLSRPEISRHFQTEQDPVARITGCCFGALVLSKLVLPKKSSISVSGRIRNAELACISAILGTEHRDVLFLPHQLHIINFRNVISLISGETDTLFTTAGTAADLLNIAQGTLYILANRLHREAFVFSGLPRDKQQVLREMFSDVMNTLRSDKLKKRTVKTLDRLQQILERLPPGVEKPQDAVIQNLDH